MTGSLAGLELFHTETPDFYRRPDLAMSEADFTACCIRILDDLIATDGTETITAFNASGPGHGKDHCRNP